MSRALVAVYMTAMAGLAVWVCWMFFDTQKPYTYDAAESFVSPNPMPQGSNVTVNWKMADKPARICPGAVMRVFTDERDVPHAMKELPISLDATPVSTSVTMQDRWLRRSFTLPPHLPAVAGYSGKVCFQCNLLQRMFPSLLCVSLPKLILYVE